jgi:GNAT superfamily N-acetyltransferase
VTHIAVGSDGDAGETVLGFATTGPARDDDREGWGELYAMYVDPDSWGTGVGRALMAGARQRLVTIGFSDAVLWALAGNDRALRFYRADGWQPDGTQRRDERRGAPVDEIRCSTTLS